ncbi:tripartite tricarboxylate transporter substrate binding protein [Verminephrobacter eiseniae]|uniref:tripartite tricarboxylate transporter substrate binding protein n=1 Tax=Verminephrobacter eiseniae TaxID=364317 RepID=UPI002237E9D3|nr:tripartite tricarboxylate transporter substrate binding protein [Verminephrobacter eiseniae]MCW5232988.1 tripartite tricarboxylate transporter substrate binding protein [Verminephrobacter eiseniae]MCW5295456.1 tripartite tricarboxylate transporter substrate binding protein [Verminephrobacter eiseniae]MCW8187198.1 tripartite tricarboxylate transporter substrate binding protein [Verminephrobacter eiseniae]MCW8224208.1 tripartite tricarboxylate transporter substrate binding protein [Verminephro
MAIDRRTLVTLLATSCAGAGAAGVGAGAAAQAQTAWPTRPIRIVVPHAAGGAADITVRTVGQKMAERLGHSVVIDNRPGAGGIVAGELVARAAPDGHTLLLISSGTAVSAALFKQLPFDTLRDFAPVSLLARFDLAVAVRAGGRMTTLAELLAYARANPGQLDIGTPQIGSTQHLAAELFKVTAGIDAQIVPFNGTPALIAAVRGGQVQVLVDILGALMPHIGAGALQALAVLGARRAAQLPQVPTVRESGGRLEHFNVSSWNGLAAPAGTPAALLERLSRTVQAALARPEVKNRLLELNLDAQGSTPAQLGEHLAADMRRWSEVIAQAGIARQ